MFDNTSSHFHECIAIFGDAWFLLIAAELHTGPKRFNELQRTIPNITPAMLSNRLKKMELYHIVIRNKPDDAKLPVIYELTDAGHNTKQILEALSDYATRYFKD